jgi:hypothetical protein
MQIVDPGHTFLLNIFDYNNEEEVLNTLRYVKREGDKYPGNIGHYCGTNLQEVCRSQISRALYVNNQIPHIRTKNFIDLQRQSIFELELRAAERHSRKLELTQEELSHIETMLYCLKCGHIGCEGNCH